MYTLSSHLTLSTHALKRFVESDKLEEIQAFCVGLAVCSIYMHVTS